MFKLFGKISLVTFVALMLSVGVDHLYRRTYKLDAFRGPKNILPYPEISEKYDIVKVGNSHAGDGLTFEGYQLTSLDLSGLAQSFAYDLAMLKMHAKQIKKGAPIIINVSPLSFSQKKPRKEDNVNMNYYDGRLSPFLIPQFKLGDYVQIQVAPFLRAGYLWREKYAQETEKRAMNAFAEIWEEPKPTPTLDPTPKVIPTPETIPSSTPEPSTTPNPLVAPIPPPTPASKFRVSDVNHQLEVSPEPPSEYLKQSAIFMVDKWHSQDFGAESFEANRKDLEALIAYCLKNNWRPVLITLPISEVLLGGLGPDYMQTYVYDHVAKIDKTGVPYFNFADNQTLIKNHSFYSNTDHLNEKGATVVSYLLLARLIEEGYLPPSANGYVDE